MSVLLTPGMLMDINENGQARIPPRAATGVKPRPQSPAPKAPPAPPAPRADAAAAEKTEKTKRKRRTKKEKAAAAAAAEKDNAAPPPATKPPHSKTAKNKEPDSPKHFAFSAFQLAPDPTALPKPSMLSKK